MPDVEVTDFVEVRGIKVREVRKSWESDDGEHTAIFVEDDKGRTLFAPEFLSHTNEYVKVEVLVNLPGHTPEIFEIVDYDLDAHAMAAVPIPHRGAKAPDVSPDPALD